jgi:hypothetical protein
MKELKCSEGPETLENLKRFASAILQANPEKKKKQPKKAASQGKSRKFDKD